MTPPLEGPYRKQRRRDVVELVVLVVVLVFLVMLIGVSR